MEQLRVKRSSSRDEFAGVDIWLTQTRIDGADLQHQDRSFCLEYTDTLIVWKDYITKQLKKL